MSRSEPKPRPSDKVDPLDKFVNEAKNWIGTFEFSHILAQYIVRQQLKDVIHVDIGNELADKYFATISISIGSGGEVQVYAKGIQEGAEGTIDLGNISDRIDKNGG